MRPPSLRKVGELRILDFDIETRKIGFHNGGRFSPDGCEPITIAASWVGDRKIMVTLQPESSLPEMLAEFAELYVAADVVTGHYIRKFDLPILNGAMLEHGLPMLPPRRAQDTKLDLVDVAGLSQSQENLGEMLALAEGKYHMNDHRWRRAARLDPEGVAKARRRAMEDVRQHKALRLMLIERGALRQPAPIWAP